MVTFKLSETHLYMLFGHPLSKKLFLIMDKL